MKDFSIAAGSQLFVAEAKDSAESKIVAPSLAKVASGLASRNWQILSRI